MKGKKVFIAFMFFFMILFIESCFSLKNTFKQELINIKPQYFYKEDNLSYLGFITTCDGSQINVHFNEHGFGNNRMAYRLIFSINSKILGCYKIEDKPFILKNCLVFPYAEKLGNKISIKENIPEKIYLNGELVLFDKIN
jgi:hypothetical protein